MRRRWRWLSGLILGGVLIAGVPAQGAEVEAGKVTLNFSGDLRLRSEYISNARFNEGDYRWRQRFRLRFGVTADLTEHTTVGFRLVSGPKNDQPSGNQTFDSENFAKFDFPIDRVFLRYKRETGPALMTLHIGKFGHPFYTLSGIVWDDDLQPAGAAEVFNLKGTGLTVALAQYVIRETDESKGTGSSLYAEQISWKGDVGATALGAGVAYYGFSNPTQIASDAKASSSDFTTNKNFGTCNGSNPGTCTGELSDFRILNLNAEATLKQLPLPLRLVVEYVNNLGAKEASVGGTSFGKENTAWLAAAYYGKAKEKGDWRVGAGYTQIEADAALANFNSDDYQQTNVNTLFSELRCQLQSKLFAIYDGYYQKRNNFDLAKANGNPATDNTTVYRHRLSLIVEF
ncbi:MAG TPA: putative porin [Candidatus Manganitrophaceae bacterium]